MKSYQRFVAELKRRHVFKVTAIYGVVSFGVLQAADLMLPRLGLPDWTVTFMVAIVVLAFPVVLIIAWAFEVTPEGVKRTDAAGPGEIEAIVAAPASQRWPVGLLALVGVAALVAGTWWIARRTAPGAGDAGAAAAAEGALADATGVRLATADLSDDDRPSIAVLPFADMSAAGDQEYFGDGMTEEILNTLAKIRELRIAGRTSAFAYKGESKDLREIGRELDVGYLVEGSVRKERDQLRITAQLIDASDGSHMWSESYDRRLENVFHARGLWDEAERAARRALELDPDNASALVALGSVLRNRRQWEESEAAYLRALASDPDNPEAHQQYAEMLFDVGRIADGRRAAERAMQLDRGAIRIVWEVHGLWIDDRPSAAIAAAQAGVRDFPAFFFLKHDLGLKYLKTARFRDLVELSPIENPAFGFRWDVSEALADDVVSRLRSGDGSMLPELWKEDPGMWMALGRPDTALSRVTRRADWVLDNTAWVWDPTLEPIRDEPAFERAIRKLNLEGRTPQRTPREEVTAP